MFTFYMLLSLAVGSVFSSPVYAPIISYPRCSIIDVSVFVVATAIAAAADVALATFVWINIAWIIVSFVYKIWESQEIVVAFSYFTGFSNSFWPWTYMYSFFHFVLYMELETLERRIYLCISSNSRLEIFRNSNLFNL